ncbi:MAG: hypothetical protein HY746_08360 [Elusimicrobia bacterium]|nr:hypothetical protein [Elusimicrobiota bacterium]
MLNLKNIRWTGKRELPRWFPLLVLITAVVFAFYLYYEIEHYLAVRNMKPCSDCEK